MKITRDEARTLAIRAQGLYPEQPFASIAAIVQQLGYVQLDTISVIERAHHHVLWTRLPGYRPADLTPVEESDRHIFEYWAHAAAYLPMNAFRYTLPRKAQIQKADKYWYEKDPTVMKTVLRRIREEGPLMSKDFKMEAPRPKNLGMDWGSNPYNLALRHLFMEGKIMVAHRRQGFQKVYDLTERVLPNHIDQRKPTMEEYLQHLIERDLRAHGLLRQREMGYLIAGIQPAVRKTLNRLMKAGILTLVEVEGKAEPYFAFPESLTNIAPLPPDPPLYLLNPFDNLIIQRQRLADLFDFQYTLECYVPAKKRRFGYFALPILQGSQFLGQIDLKADRQSGQLLVQNTAWVTRPNGVQEAALQQALEQFAIFCGTATVTWR